MSLTRSARLGTFVATLLAGTAIGCHATPNAASPTATTILPLRAVHLYETGVGYFERSGEIGDPKSTTLPVPAGHLDDALKTLVIIGAGKVRGVEFGSSLSAGMARAQAGLPLDADTPITWRDLLSALKGSPVEITTQTGKVSGRLIDVVEEQDPSAKKPDPKADGKEEPKAMVLLVLGDNGELRRVPATTVTSVKPLDPAYAARLGSSLDTLSTRNASTPRPLGLLGDTKGPITFGYIAETPVWRASYRLVFAPDRKSAVMQGWALLHNDTDESWRKVKVSLVNGRPDSFLFPLAAPRYARRTLVAPENELSTVPQLSQKTADAIWGDHVEGESVGVGGIGTIGHGYGSGSGYGYGSGTGKISIPTVTMGSSSLLAVGDLSGVATAEGVESGALFTYTLDDGLDLGAHKSALVPFLAQQIDAQPITWIDKDAARAGVRLSNNTAQTLPGGTIAFFAAGAGAGFVGESGLDRLKPGERRFLDFGADLDVELDKKDTTVEETVKRVRFVGDALEEHFLRVTKATWELQNHAGLERDVYVVLHLDRNTKLEGVARQEYDTATNRPIAVFHVGAKSKLEKPVTSTEGLSRRTARSALTYARLSKLATEATLPANERAALAEIAARQKELEDAREERRKTEETIATVEKDLLRFREHLKALGDKAGPNPFVKRIVDKEDELTALRKKQDAQAKDLEAKALAVKTALAKLG
jgi:hypothetical protein